MRNLGFFRATLAALGLIVLFHSTGNSQPAAVPLGGACPPPGEAGGVGMVRAAFVASDMARFPDRLTGAAGGRRPALAGEVPVGSPQPKVGRPRSRRSTQPSWARKSTTRLG